MPSQQEWVPITCPKCKTVQSVYVYKVADAGEEPEIREKLFRGELNISQCTGCKAPLHYDEYMIYADREKGLIVNVFSGDYKSKEDELVKKIFEEIYPLPPEDVLPNYLIFGFHTLSRTIALMERRLKIMSVSEVRSLGHEDYQKLLVLCEGWLTVAAIPGYEAKLTEAESHFSDAGLLIREKKYGQAHDAYEKIVLGFPEFFEANLNLGLLYFNELDDIAKALPLFEKCRALRPNESEVYFALGQIHLKQKSADKAVACFYRAAILSPSSTLAWFNLGLGLTLLGKKDDGLDMLEKSLALAYNPDDRNVIARTIKSLTPQGATP